MKCLSPFAEIMPIISWLRVGKLSADKVARVGFPLETTLKSYILPSQVSNVKHETTSDPVDQPHLF